EDPDAFEHAVQATNRVLEAVRPQGTRTIAVPSDESQEEQDLAAMQNEIGHILAGLLVSEVGQVEPTEPASTEKMSDYGRLLRRIASGLGPVLHGRLKKA